MKKRCNYLTKADIEAIGGKIAADEEFRHVKGETAIWVSNYARIISKRRGKARILKTVFQKGYHRLTLPQYMRGKKVKHMYYVHVLVAEAFCSIPKWIKPGDRLEAHHIHSVDRECDIDWIIMPVTLCMCLENYIKRLIRLLKLQSEEITRGLRRILYRQQNTMEFLHMNF